MSDIKKKIPMRMCVGCRQMHEKKSLVRIVRDADGKLQIDLRGKAAGRGAYVCHNSQCLEKAIRIGAIERALGVKPDEQIMQTLLEEM